MDEVATSRSACCCRYGALDNFGLLASASDWPAAHSPQKIQEIRFLDALASNRPNVSSGCPARGHRFNYTLRFPDLDTATFGSWQSL